MPVTQPTPQGQSGLERSDLHEVIEHPCQQVRNLRPTGRTATVVVDGELRLERFDRTAAYAFALSDEDLGCSLAELGGRIDVHAEDLEWCIGHVMSEERSLAGELEGENGSRFEILVQPFAPTPGQAPGASVTLTDVTHLERVEADLKRVADRDLTERAEAERRRDLLVKELDHRVKNVLTIVLGILERTAATSDSFDSFVPTFRDRINALAVAHRAMAGAEWEGAPLRELVARVMRPLGCHERIRAEGDDIVLPAAVVSPLAMALHELATNAVRHGALSAESGEVTVRWNVERTDDDERVRLVWSEAGGPRVEAPSKPGFGTRLIREGIPYEIGGSTSLEFRPEGVQCEIEAPLGDVGH